MVVVAGWALPIGASLSAFGSALAAAPSATGLAAPHLDPGYPPSGPVGGSFVMAPGSTGAVTLPVQAPAQAPAQGPAQAPAQAPVQEPAGHVLPFTGQDLDRQLEIGSVALLGGLASVLAGRKRARR
ncbi:MAG: hypothetical protein NVS3B26_21480 [Mycobacteriales bacterium]